MCLRVLKKSVLKLLDRTVYVKQRCQFKVQDVCTLTGNRN